MTNEVFFNLIERTVNWLRDLAPKRTGNLAYNAIRMVSFGDEAHIFIDESIAPYMKFTNEPWIADRWGGAKNPNEHWFDKAVLTIMARIAIELGADVQQKGNDKND